MGGIKHTYTLDGAKILREQWVEGENIKWEITPLYDNEDNVCGILHCDIPYYFLKNLQGDVIAITNQYGETVARYTYDAWGACTITYDATATPTVEGGEPINIATVNPFRYRSYYFDTETGLYYLQSRYYDPTLGRFVNGDEPVVLGSVEIPTQLNLIAYCKNDPVDGFDPLGYSSVGLVLSTSLTASLGGALPGIMVSISASMASLKTAIATSWYIPVCIAAAAIAVIGIVYVVNRMVALAISSQRVITAVKSNVRQKLVNERKLRNYTVYVIVYNGTVDVVYVGMTKNYAARKRAHTGKRFPKSMYTMMPIATGLNYREAHALEQTIITAYTLITLKNIINSIAPKRWGEFITEFAQMTTLIESWIAPE